MERVVSFYEKLPRGPAPEVQSRGLIDRYQARYFGKNPSAARKTSILSVEHIGSEMAKQLCSLRSLNWSHVGPRLLSALLFPFP